MAPTAFRVLPIAVLFAIPAGGQTPPANGATGCSAGTMLEPARPPAPRCATPDALGSLFHRGPSKDDMVRDLTAGRLYLENVSFKAAAADATSGSDKALATLVDALKSADGRFVLKVTDESDGKAPADAKLAQTRARHLVAKLHSAGVPVTKVTSAPLPFTASWTTAAPVKSDAHLELVALPQEHKR